MICRDLGFRDPGSKMAYPPGIWLVSRWRHLAGNSKRGWKAKNEGKRDVYDTTAIRNQWLMTLLYRVDPISLPANLTRNENPGKPLPLNSEPSQRSEKALKGFMHFSTLNDSYRQVRRFWRCI
jgi:hypothetical protein